MPRLLVGVRHAALAIELRRQGFEVLDLRDVEPDDDTGPAASAAVDAVLADAAAMADRAGARPRLLDRARDVPLVVLAAPGEWELLHGSDVPSDVLVVGSPVSAADLAASIRGRLPVVEPQAALVDADVEPPPPPEPAGATSRPEPDPVSRPVVVDVPEPSRPDPLPVEDRGPDGDVADGPATAGPDLAAAADAVRRHAAALGGLEQVAGDAVRALAAACAAEGAALLVPAGSEHAVLAGLGLRPLEGRLTVAADCWLARQLAQVGPVLLVEDTDLHRAELAGTPAARHRHLLAVRWSDPDLLVIAGRSDRPFARRDVTAVLGALPAVLAPLVQALALRELALVLASFA